MKMDLRGIGWDGVDWIDLAQDRDQWRALVNTVMNLTAPIKFSELVFTASFELFVKFIDVNANCNASTDFRKIRRY
jgi:hypothetical protein